MEVYFGHCLDVEVKSAMFSVRLAFESEFRPNITAKHVYEWADYKVLVRSNGCTGKVICHPFMTVAQKFISLGSVRYKLRILISQVSGTLSKALA